MRSILARGSRGREAPASPTPGTPGPTSKHRAPSTAADTAESCGGRGAHSAEVAGVLALGHVSRKWQLDLCPLTCLKIKGCDFHISARSWAGSLLASRAAASGWAGGRCRAAAAPGSVPGTVGRCQGKAISQRLFTKWPFKFIDFSERSLSGNSCAVPPRLPRPTSRPSGRAPPGGPAGTPPRSPAPPHVPSGRREVQGSLLATWEGPGFLPHPLWTSCRPSERAI